MTSRTIDGTKIARGRIWCNPENHAASVAPDLWQAQNDPVSGDGVNGAASLACWQRRQGPETSDSLRTASNGMALVVPDIAFLRLMTGWNWAASRRVSPLSGV